MIVLGLDVSRRGKWLMELVAATLVLIAFTGCAQRAVQDRDAAVRNENDRRAWRDQAQSWERVWHTLAAAAESETAEQMHSAVLDALEFADAKYRESVGYSGDAAKLLRLGDTRNWTAPTAPTADNPDVRGVLDRAAKAIEENK